MAVTPRVSVTALSLLLALSACSAAPVPADRYYRLALPAVTTPLVQDFPRLIVITPVEANGVLAERALLYRLGDDPSLQRYPAQLWAEPPSVMLAQAFAERLAAQLDSTKVYLVPDRMQPDLLVRSSLRRLESVGDASGSWAELALDFAVSDVNGPLFRHSVSYREPVQPADIAQYTRVQAGLLARACDELARLIVERAPASGALREEAVQ